MQKWYLKVADSTLTDFDFELAEPTFFNAVGPDDPNPERAEEGWRWGGEKQDLANFVMVYVLISTLGFIVYVN